MNQRNHNNERWSGDNGVDPEDPDQSYCLMFECHGIRSALPSPSPTRHNASMSGPQTKVTLDTAPISPLGSANLERGTEFDRIVGTRDKILPVPSTAIARLLHQVIDL